MLLPAPLCTPPPRSVQFRIILGVFWCAAAAGFIYYVVVKVFRRLTEDKTRIELSLQFHKGVAKKVPAMLRPHPPHSPISLPPLLLSSCDHPHY
jgi:hypothetical protein